MCQKIDCPQLRGDVCGLAERLNQPNLQTAEIQRLEKERMELEHMKRNLEERTLINAPIMNVDMTGRIVAGGPGYIGYAGAPKNRNVCRGGERHNWETIETLTAWIDKANRVPRSKTFLKRCRDCGDHATEGVTLND